MGKRLTKLFMLLCIILFVVPFKSPVKCLGDMKDLNGYQYIYDEYGNEIFHIEITDMGNIIFYGKHAKSTSKYTYHTTSFTMALKSSNRTPNSIDNYLRIERMNDTISDNRKDDFERYDYTIDTYCLDCNDVIQNVVQLLRNQGYSKQASYKMLANGVDVYFSNIFEVILRDSQERIGNQEYYSYEEINNALYNLKGIRWSEKTQELLKYYYDNVIHIQLSPFYYQVVYVEAEDYKKNGTNANIMKQEKEEYEIYFGQNTGYVIPKNDPLSINKKKYNITGAEYVYENGQSNTTNRPIVSNVEISAYHGSRQDATLYILLEEEKTTPTATPTPTVRPEPNTVTEPAIPPVTEVGRPIITRESYTSMQPYAKSIINAMNNNNTRYDAKKGVPATEDLYVSVHALPYLISLSWEENRGTIEYPYTVEKTYRIVQTDPNTKKKIEQRKTVTQSGSITKSYVYYTIASIEYYQIQNAIIENPLLPKQKISLSAKETPVPKLTYTHWENLDEHVKVPDEMEAIITLPEVVVTSYEEENLLTEGMSYLEDLSIRNDEVTFHGKEVMDGRWKKGKTSEIDLSPFQTITSVVDSLLYGENYTISYKQENGTYHSDGMISYKAIAQYQSQDTDLLQYPIQNINSVKVHTPAYCKPIVSNDNSAYIQVTESEPNVMPLVIDRNSKIGDFVLRISNEGFHSDLPGYKSNNYQRYLAKKDGLLQNEVQFPVDMYRDVENDFKTENDELIPKGTWCCIGIEEQRFYTPMWIEEGIYEAKIRSVTINAGNQLKKEQNVKNSNIDNYVAVNQFRFEVMGRLFGLTMYDIQDYPLWMQVFRKENSQQLKRYANYQQHLTNSNTLFDCPEGVQKEEYQKSSMYNYTVGINDSYGNLTTRLNKYTIPLLDGDHPEYQNQGLLKTGYTVRFFVKTTGNVMAEKDAHIMVKPRFYYVDENGNNRTEVDLYYSGVINGKKYACIQVGSELERNQLISFTPGDVLLGIPKEELEITSKLDSKPIRELKKMKKSVYSYSEIKVGVPFKMYSNLQYANDAHIKKTIPENLKAEELTKYQQTYYFSYSLPDHVKAVKKETNVAKYAKEHGITFKEDFWLKKGYLIVNFDILAIDSFGKPRYSYINKKNYQEKEQCSMWLMEGGVKEKQINKIVFQFLAGDALIYSLKETAADDYERDGLY